MGMANPKISIIIPVYNLDNYISRCLVSIINQEYKNMEIIVVDDGSTDNSWEVISKYQQADSRIIAIKQKNGGAGKARNVALQNVSGDLITFVDGDDMLSRETLQELHVLFRDTELDWVEFPVVRVSIDNKNLSNPIDYACFSPHEDLVCGATNFIDLLQQKKLSELCCACIYRWTSVQNIRFPENEYFEDSFYFTDVIVRTHKGMVSAKGQYRYVERIGSSQLSVLDKKRLVSKVKCIEDRLTKFRKAYPQYDEFYAQIESNLYYYLKIQRAKNVDGADELFNNLKHSLRYPLKRRLLVEFQYYIYKYIGYHNIKKMLKIFRRS